MDSRARFGFVAAFVVALTLVIAMTVTSAAAAGASGDPGKGTVLVVGADGRTGRHIVSQLQAKGFTVRAFVRDKQKGLKVLGDKVDFVQGDIRKPDDMAAAVKGVDYVISAVGSGRKDPSNTPETVDYHGVKNLAEAAAAAGVKQLVLISSAGVTHEDNPLNKMFNNILIWKFKGEQAIRKSGVPYTIIRPAGLIDKPSGQHGMIFQQGDTRSRGLIPRGDLALVCVAALLYPESRNKTFELFGTKGPPDYDLQNSFAGLKKD